jgi:hypothetical protein
MKKEKEKEKPRNTRIRRQYRNCGSKGHFGGRWSKKLKSLEKLQRCQVAAARLFRVFRDPKTLKLTRRRMYSVSSLLAAEASVAVELPLVRTALVVPR